jgi:amino acid adenylation domain-containing protein
VIYTSGSTGQPKGVGVTHKSLVNHHAAVRNAYGLRAGDRVLQFASLSFDVAAEEIFPTLLTGATVVLHDGEMPGLGRDFVREVKDNGVTVLNLPASAWCEWVDWWADESSQSREELPDCLRLVIVGSERVPEESFAAWRQVASERTRLLNAYGTTETSITATLYSPVMTENEAGAGRALPIGRPLANTQTYILDRLMQPVPVGIGGELYLGGAGLARGYLNRPDATAEKFIPNPFGDEPGTRLYQTGDLARYLPDGNIEFIRRVDRQVKVRGFRIELGEIEAVLNEHANVRHAVVEASADRSGLNQLVGYVVTEQNQPSAKKELREFLRDRLPEFMVPSVFVMMKELPLTPGGKVDRRALPAPEEARGEAEDLVLPRSQVEHAIAAIWREVLRLEQVGVHENFFDLGGHSLLLVRVHNRLQKALDQDITVLDLFKYPTIRLLAEYIAPEQASLKSHGFQAAAPKDQTRPEGSEIAIIGMAGRFPGSKDLEEFWRNLCQGVEAVSFFSDQELIEAGVGPALLNDPNYVKAGVVLDDIDQFDALFFGYSPREAEVMDPQHRLFLECASEALERAGHDSEQSGESVGVFAGTGTGTYVYNLLSNPEIIEAVGGLQLAIGNDKDHLPTHVSYKLNLRGPSIAVQTACSASLVAVHMACRSVLEGECKMALAGGVAVHEMDKRGYLFQEGGIGSPDGHCRAFDADAQGTISGSGVGVVVLKRLQDALADGDFIHAVIKGSAVNNDGSAKVGYTAPSVQGQAEVIRAAQIAAGVDAESITYIEAHGTGTRLGDPIEIAALTQVFRENTNREDFCAVGSLKTNIGHLDTAAGVAGLIKTVLALEHKAIPPSLHFQQPNPALELESSPFYINSSLTEWKSDNGSRRAGVSSFGIGGTNAHVIVEEAPPVGHSSDGRPWHLLMLSAQTDTALNQATANLAAYLEAHPESNLADVAYTMQVGRKTFSHRRVVICHELDDAIRGLELLDPQRVFTVTDQARGRDVVFMFPGQGVQSVNMGRDLYQHEAVFREQVDRCSEMLKSHIGFDLRDVLYPAEEAMEDAAAKLQQTRVTQPALFVIEYALAQLWMKWGVKPRAMIGHSIGEYVAACLAGVFSLADALSLVALRGKLMQSLPEGGMLSVALAEDELRGMLGNQLSLAAVNGPSLSVVSGPDDAVSDLQDRLAAKKVGYRRLLTSHAFHSHMMAPIIAEFTAQVRKVKLNAPQIRYLSNVSGTWISRNDATDPGYWARHLRQTVRFADGARELLRDSDATLLEVGPGQTLSTMIRPLARETGQFVVNSQRHPQEQGSDEEVLMKALGRLWLAGVRIDWQGFYAHEVRHRLPLPTYPFERRSYWVGWQKPAASDGDNQPRKKPDVADWFYLPHWKPSVSPIVKASSTGAEQSPVWLVFPDERGFSKRIAEQLEQRGAEVFMVRGGERFERLDDRSYAINVAHPEDYEALVLDLKSRSKMPSSVLHSLSVTASEAD